MLEVRKKQLIGVEKKLSEVKERLERLEEKYFADKIEEVTYDKWSKRYGREILDLELKRDRLFSDYEDIWNLLGTNLAKATDLCYIYSKCTVSDKHIFLTLVGGKWILKNGTLEPQDVLPIFKGKSLLDNELPQNENGGFSIKNANSPACTRDGTIIEPF